MTLHLQDEIGVVRKTGNIFLTNIHRVYDTNQKQASIDDEDLSDYFLGTRPVGATTDSKVDLGDIVRDIDELAVFNDEAHHIHDEKLAWFKSIEDIHNRMLIKVCSLSIQIDVTATPKHNNGAIFVQTISDYPLADIRNISQINHHHQGLSSPRLDVPPTTSPVCNFTTPPLTISEENKSSISQRTHAVISHVRSSNRVHRMKKVFLVHPRPT